MKGCVCGHPTAKPLTPREVDLYSRLRGSKIVLCVLCRHEVFAPRSAKDVRALAIVGDDWESWAHRACVKARDLRGGAR